MVLELSAAAISFDQGLQANSIFQPAFPHATQSTPLDLLA